MKKILIICFCIYSSLLAAQSFEAENSVGNLVDLKYAFDHAHILSYHPLEGNLSIANILNKKENKTHLILLASNGLHLDSLFINNASIKDFYPISEHVFLISTNDRFYAIYYTAQKLKILDEKEANTEVIAFAHEDREVTYTTKSIAKRRVLNIQVKFTDHIEELEYKFKDTLSKDEFPVSLQWPERKFYIEDKMYFPLPHSNILVSIDFQNETIKETNLPKSLAGKAYYNLYDYQLKKWFVVEMISHYKNKLYEFDLNTNETYFLEEINHYPSWIDAGVIYFRDFINHNYAISSKKLKLYYLNE